jgi:hypothetical protein
LPLLRRFKQHRLKGFAQAIAWIHDAAPDDRSQPSAVALLVVLIWMMNALNQRPADMSAERRMALQLQPFRTEHVVGELGEHEQRIALPIQGACFVSRIRCDKHEHACPRVNDTIRIPDEDFNGITGFTYLSWQLHTMAHKNVRQQTPIAVDAASTVRPLQLPNKAAETKLVDTISAGVRVLDSVEDLGFSLRPPVRKRVASETSSVNMGPNALALRRVFCAIFPICDEPQQL